MSPFSKLYVWKLIILYWCNISLPLHHWWNDIRLCVSMHWNNINYHLPFYCKTEYNNWQGGKAPELILTKVGWTGRPCCRCYSSTYSPTGSIIWCDIQYNIMLTEAGQHEERIFRLDLWQNKIWIILFQGQTSVITIEMLLITISREMAEFWQIK